MSRTDPDILEEESKRRSDASPRAASDDGGGVLSPPSTSPPSPRPVVADPGPVDDERDVASANATATGRREGALSPALSEEHKSDDNVKTKDLVEPPRGLGVTERKAPIQPNITPVAAPMTQEERPSKLPLPMSPWCQWCCPCVLLGSMYSDETRESDSSKKAHSKGAHESVPFFLNCCFRLDTCTEKRIHLGPKGCSVCMYSAMLCLCGWPCSPFLHCYVSKLDRELKRIHPDDKALAAKTSVCCISWPYTILRHKNIYDERVMNGTLHYSWAHDVSYESKEPPHKTLFVVGVTAGSGKSTLAKKLCNDPDQEERDHTRLHIGVVSLHNPSHDRSAVLEVWDFPSRLEGLVSSYCPDFAVIVYDSGDEQSFIETRAFWERLKESWKDKVHVFLVGSKIDLWSKDVDIFENIDAALWKDASMQLSTGVAEWAQEEGIDYRLVSCPLNDGIQGITKSVAQIALMQT